MPALRRFVYKTNDPKKALTLESSGVTLCTYKPEEIRLCVKFAITGGAQRIYVRLP
jgi:hypothetical protein